MDSSTIFSIFFAGCLESKNLEMTKFLILSRYFSRPISQALSNTLSSKPDKGKYGIKF